VRPCLGVILPGRFADGLAFCHKTVIFVIKLSYSPVTLGWRLTVTVNGVDNESNG